MRNTVYICISYVTSVRYVARINHEGRVIYSGNVPNRGHDTGVQTNARPHARGG